MKRNAKSFDKCLFVIVDILKIKIRKIELVRRVRALPVKEKELHSGLDSDLWFLGLAKEI